MHDQSSIRLVQAASVISLTLTLTINALSTTMPLNGRTAGQITHRFNNLLVPERMIFLIWALIYVLLLLYVINIQMRLHRLPPEEQPPLVSQGWLFALSGLLNSAWIMAWHYYQLRLSMGIMLILLVILVMIYADIPVDMPWRKRWLKRLPFSIYSAWISFLFLINTAAFLIGTGWTGGIFGQEFWALLALAGLVVLGWLALLWRRDYGFTLTLAWGIAGILIQHLITRQSAYPLIISGAGAALVLLFAGILLAARRQHHLKKFVKP